MSFYEKEFLIDLDKENYNESVSEEESEEESNNI